MNDDQSELSLDGVTLVGVENDGGEVDGDTHLHFNQDGTVLTGHYAGGSIVQGYLVGTLDGGTWDIRYTQLTTDGETKTGHSIGDVTRLPDGRIRVEDDWEWDSHPGGGSSVLEEVPDADGDE